MEYWIERCPHCAAARKRSSIDNDKKFGTPLVSCHACGKYYVHADRMEIGLLAEHELKRFEGKMMFSLLWRLCFVAVLAYVVLAEVIHISCVLSALSVGVVFVLLVVRGMTSIRKNLQEELSLSQTRLKQPGYRELLERCGYKPRWRP